MDFFEYGKKALNQTLYNGFKKKLNYVNKKYGRKKIKNMKYKKKGQIHNLNMKSCGNNP